MVWEGTNPPEEPAGYDPKNKYADPVLYFKHREALVAEEFVKVAEAKVSARRWAVAAAAQLEAALRRHRLVWPIPCSFPFSAQLIRKKLKQCYKESGTNYQQNCQELAQVCVGCGGASVLAAAPVPARGARCLDACR